MSEKAVKGKKRGRLAREKKEWTYIQNKGRVKSVKTGAKSFGWEGIT